jgi:hypothetical protein
MSAYLFIRDKRRALEKIDFVSQLGMAMKGSPKTIERRMERWAREAEVNLIFDDE